MMPLHPAMGKMMLLGALLGAFDPVATVVAVIGCRSPIVHSIDRKEGVRGLRGCGTCIAAYVSDVSYTDISNAAS